MQSRPPLSAAVTALGDPPIPLVGAWASAYTGAFGPRIDLAQAAPGAPPHPDLLRALADAAGARETARYGAIGGEEDLRRALADDLGRAYGVSAALVGADDIAITAGCNAAFVTAMLAIGAPGDDILLPAPWYFNHETSLAMLGQRARALPCREEGGFIPDPDEAAALIGPRTRAIVLVTPNNPTGAVYPPDTIAAFADLCRARRIWLVLDETYRDFRPGPDAPHALFASGDWRYNLIHLYSFSKAYAVPGHRLGALVADRAVIRACLRILDNVQICPARAGQIALARTMPALAGWREANRAMMLARADAFREAMSALADWRIAAMGSYFAYLRHPFAGVAGAEICRALAGERGVACVPGSFFGPGQDAYLRIAFANAPQEAIATLPDRLARFEPPSGRDSAGPTR